MFFLAAGSPTLGEVDEYSSDGDVGYVRKRVAHQQAFIARELDLSDEDGSARGTDLYHQAQAHTQSQVLCLDHAPASARM